MYKYLIYAKYQIAASDINVHKATWLSGFQLASRSKLEFFGLCSEYKPELIILIVPSTLQYIILEVLFLAMG